MELEVVEIELGNVREMREVKGGRPGAFHRLQSDESVSSTAMFLGDGDVRIPLKLVSLTPRRATPHPPRAL